ncbi:unnamed protein product [Clonostachys chloroleuca]|uniref:Uncharacterized protein n=1 Tax=Clonostachys chloroleuca TaxID=1926264 RepID=A0AA35M8A1_9HYPO|nr:unnamed protein product [Clonostachys chloroleuca]
MMRSKSSQTLGSLWHNKLNCSFNEPPNYSSISSALSARTVVEGEGSKVAETGVVAENAGSASDANLDRVGLPGITEMEDLSMLEMAITSNNLSDNGLVAQDNGEREHIVTSIIDLVKSDSSGEREALFWGRDPIFSHMPYKADTVSLKKVVSTRDKIDDDKLLIEVMKALT